MAQTLRDPVEPHSVTHVRRLDLVRPERTPRLFPERQAQRRLREKERHWAPLAYGVFGFAVLVIFCVAYTTYAFSKYRDVVLPGVYVDGLSVAGMTAKQADDAVQLQLARIHLVPVALTYNVYSGNQAFRPTADQIGVTYPRGATGKAAMAVGRNGSLIDQIIDRLPIHPTHVISAVYNLDVRKLRAYLNQAVARVIDRQQAKNAGISRNVGNDGFHVFPSAAPGLRLDVNAAIADVQSVLGSLDKHTVALRVFHIQPAITDDDANRILGSVNRLLDHPPIISLGKRVFVMPRSAIVPMLSFKDVTKPQPDIKMIIDGTAVQKYVGSLAAQVDRPAQNAKMTFSGGKVRVIQQRRAGRSLDQAGATAALLAAVKQLHSDARLHFNVSVTQPTIDVTDPASLGINALLGEGVSSFKGAGEVRLSGVTQIAQSLDQVVIKPGDEISFNSLVGTGWNPRVYDDQETMVNGQLVPGDHGSMQQVATTFLRAMYASGLKLLERHAHPYELGWYEPPYGYDAVVAPGRNWDLRFANTTRKYLLIETRVEPLRQELYIYVYGANQHWKVSVDPTGKILKTYPHGPAIVQQNSSLPPGSRTQIAWPHTGADTVITRTIVYPNGSIAKDQISTHYQPQQAIVEEGSPKPKATPTPSPEPSPSVTASPTPTATFNH